MTRCIGPRQLGVTVSFIPRTPIWFHASAALSPGVRRADVAPPPVFFLGARDNTYFPPDPLRTNSPTLLRRAMLHTGSNGVVYPSVRHPCGTSVACFRSAL